MMNDRHTMRIAFRVRTGSEEVRQQFAKDHGANYQVAQLLNETVELDGSP